MSAKTFFAMLEQGDRSKMVETSRLLFDLQDVVTFPHATPEWRTQQREYLWSRITYYEKKPQPLKRGVQLKHEDAAKVLVSAFALKAKVEGVHGRRTK